MNRKNRKRILGIALAVLLILTVIIAAAPRTAKAFGDFDSHSDYGGSSHSSSGSDGDSDDGFDLYTLIRIATFFGELLGIESPIVSILLALAIFLAIKFGLAYLRGRSGNAPKHQGNERENMYRPETLNLLMEEDPSFDSYGLAERVKSLFEQMQACWEEGNIDPLRKDFMPDTWTRFNTQLQNKNAAGETAHVRNIVFGPVTPQSYTTDAEHQIIKIKIDVTHNVWTTNREGKCIQGTEETRKRFVFLWTMTRPLGSRTGGEAPADTSHCPNCGAEIDMEAFAECPFCHTPFMQVSPDWVISEIDALSQTTLHK